MTWFFDHEAACRRALRRHGYQLVKMRSRAPDPLAKHYIIVERDLKKAIAVLDLAGVVAWVEDLKKTQRLH